MEKEFGTKFCSSALLDQLQANYFKCSSRKRKVISFLSFRCNLTELMFPRNQVKFFFGLIYETGIMVHPKTAFSEFSRKGNGNYVSKKPSVKFVGLVIAQISVKQPPQSFLGTSVIAGHLSRCPTGTSINWFPFSPIL